MHRAFRRLLSREEKVMTISFSVDSDGEWLRFAYSLDDGDHTLTGECTLSNPPANGDIRTLRSQFVAVFHDQAIAINEGLQHIFR
jgi:hypothetical protein